MGGKGTKTKMGRFLISDPAKLSISIPLRKSLYASGSSSQRLDPMCVFNKHQTMRTEGISFKGIKG